MEMVEEKELQNEYYDVKMLSVSSVKKFFPGSLNQARKLSFMAIMYIVPFKMLWKKLMSI